MRKRDWYSYIILSGPAGAGKTLFGEWLSRKIEIPLLQQDVIMEVLFKYYAPHSRGASRKLRGISYELFFSFLNVVLRDRIPIIIESGFHRGEHEKPLRRLQQLHNAYPIQLHFSAKVDILINRFQHHIIPRRLSRWYDRELSLKEFRGKIVRGVYDPLDIGGLLVRIDTTQGLRQKDRVRLLSLIRSRLH